MSKPKIPGDLEPMLRPVTDLVLLPGNARRGDVAAVADSLKRFGQRKPIVVNDDGVIIAGNHTYQAAVSLGWDAVAVVTADDLEPSEQRAYALADNRLSDLATWDQPALYAQLAELDDFTGVGWDEDELPAIHDAIWPPDTFEETVFGGYTRKVKSPIYEIPAGTPPPPLSDLYDRTRTVELIEAIEATDLEADVKAFLVAAAERHTVFQYNRIAEWYAAADPEVQELMEQSALVIIDFDRAVEDGFVELRGNLMELYRHDTAE